jgi:hypothetical protein
MRPVQQENLTSIRIGGRDPGKTILVKEHVLRFSGEPFTFSVLLAKVVVTFFPAGMDCFFSFGPRSYLLYLLDFPRYPRILVNVGKG